MMPTTMVLAAGTSEADPHEGSRQWRLDARDQCRSRAGMTGARAGPGEWVEPLLKGWAAEAGAAAWPRERRGLRAHGILTGRGAARAPTPGATISVAAGRFLQLASGTMRPCSGRIWSTASPCFVMFSSRLTLNGLGGLIGAMFGAGGV